MQVVKDKEGEHVHLNSYEREILLNRNYQDREEIVRVLYPLNKQFLRKEILVILSENHIDNWTIKKLRKYLGPRQRLTRRERRLLESLKNQMIKDPKFRENVARSLFESKSKKRVGTVTNETEDRKLLKRIKDKELLLEA